MLHKFSNHFGRHGKINSSKTRNKNCLLQDHHIITESLHMRAWRMWCNNNSLTLDSLYITYTFLSHHKSYNSFKGQNYLEDRIWSDQRLLIIKIHVHDRLWILVRSFILLHFIRKFEIKVQTIWRYPWFNPYTNSTKHPLV